MSHLRVALALSILGCSAFISSGCGKTGQGSTQAANKKMAGPPLQRKFCEIYDQAQQEQKRLSEQKGNELNPIRREKLDGQQARSEVEVFDKLFAAVKEGVFENWQGRMMFIPTTDYVNPHLNREVRVTEVTFRPTCPSRFEMRTGHLSNPEVNTNVLPDSPLMAVLGTLDLNRDVIASGTFVWAKDRQVWGPYGGTISDKRHFAPGAYANAWPSATYPWAMEIMASFTSIAQAP